MSPFEQPSAYGSCTFKPVVREASLWPIGCPELAGTSQSGVQVGRPKPVIQGGPAREIESGSPGAGYGRDLQFGLSPDSRRSWRPARADAGAADLQPSAASAFPNRDTAHDINVFASWLTDDAGEADRHIAWVRRFLHAREQHSRGVYVNFVSDDVTDRIRAAYSDQRLVWLAALKASGPPMGQQRAIPLSGWLPAFATARTVAQVGVGVVPAQVQRNGINDGPQECHSSAWWASAWWPRCAQYQSTTSAFSTTSPLMYAASPSSEAFPC